MTVTIKKESAPGNTSTEDSLENKIENARNWTVFPAIGVQSSKFTYVYEIMKLQAQETNDMDLGEAADIIMLHIRGQLSLPWIW